MTKDGQTCESEGFEQIPDAAECIEAIEFLNGGAPIWNGINEVHMVTAPFGCSTGCVRDGYYFCESFNTRESMKNKVVDSSNDDYIYCRAQPSSIYLNNILFFLKSIETIYG